MDLRRLLLIVLLGMYAVAHADDVYIIDPPQTATDTRKEQVRHLLKAVLEASKPQYGSYRLLTAPNHMERSRLLLELKAGNSVNVSAQITDTDWERELIPIRIPVDKGLYGFRVSLIDGRRQSVFSGIDSLSQLKRLSVGSGDQWSVRSLYEKDGFKVVAGSSYTGLFAMLLEGRFDQLPRSIEDAPLELEQQAPQNPNLALEKSFIVYFPAPRYFFVSPTEPRLAERLRFGLEKLIGSGEFDRMFLAYYGPFIAQSELCKRKIFRIANPALPPETPLQRTQLWFDPFRSAGNAATCQAAVNAATKAKTH